MSTAHELAPGLDIVEQSCKVSFGVEVGDGYYRYCNALTADEFRLAIIKQIEVLSYISDDPEEVLRRFNVDYGETA